MERQFPDFLNAMEWNLVARRSLQVQSVSQKAYNPIPPQSFLLESFVLMIGVRNVEAPNRWYLGAWATMFAPMLPGSTSEFVASVVVTQRKIRLGVLNLVVFPKVMAPYLLEVKFPAWHEQILLEVWRYDGQDVDQFYQLDQLQQSADSLSGKLDDLDRKIDTLYNP
jgi:hypothetical protein